MASTSHVGGLVAFYVALGLCLLALTAVGVRDWRRAMKSADPLATSQRDQAVAAGGAVGVAAPALVLTKLDAPRGLVLAYLVVVICACTTYLLIRRR